MTGKAGVLAWFEAQLTGATLAVWSVADGTLIETVDFSAEGEQPTALAFRPRRRSAVRRHQPRCAASVRRVARFSVAVAHAG